MFSVLLFMKSILQLHVSTFVGQNINKCADTDPIKLYLQKQTMSHVWATFVSDIKLLNLVVVSR